MPSKLPKLKFSLYLHDVWRFGEWGHYFCIGPLYFTTQPDSQLETEKPEKVKSVLETVVDYDVDITSRYDTYTLRLETGETEERKFARLTEDREDGSYTKSCKESVRFSNKLQEKCGY